MKTVFETITKDFDFIIDKDRDNDLHLYTLNSIEESPYSSFEFHLKKEEALNLAQHILKLYSE